jgi:predicted nucleotidyltransferase
MRLQPSAIEAIRDVVVAECGDAAEVRLFGSRLDDTAKGGDVDLHVVLHRDVPNPVWLAALLAGRIERRLEGRKVDVRLVTPSTVRMSVDEVAMREGQVL